MRNTVVLITSLLAASSSATIGAEDAQSILEKMQRMRIERWEGVENYTVVLTVAGQRSVQYFERVQGLDSKADPVFRLVPPTVLQHRHAAATGQRELSPEDLETYANAMEMTGEAMGQQIETDMANMGLPPGLLRVSGFDPRSIMGGESAMVLHAGTQAKREVVADDGGVAEAETEAVELARFAETARLAGKDKVDGRTAYRLVSDDLALEQEGDRGEFTINTMTVWVDAEHFVVRRMRLDGAVQQGRDTKPLYMENESSDYRVVADSSMYEPYRRVLRMGGVLSAKEQKQMQEAQKKMAEFEHKMAAMPANQREMIMRQMGPQMEMMRKMAATGGLETVSEVHEILVNAGLPNPNQLNQMFPGLPPGP